MADALAARHRRDRRLFGIGRRQCRRRLRGRFRIVRHCRSRRRNAEHPRRALRIALGVGSVGGAGRGMRRFARRFVRRFVRRLARGFMRRFVQATPAHHDRRRRLLRRRDGRGPEGRFGGESRCALRPFLELPAV
ncbi:MAG: hypothetical protein KGL18_05520 [Burkholderiales bacterium]|nr:hypothetical protein [Burkholderiales bacterium]MDE2158590.1 hypothetical protein [Burkholderiales bacterium]MDE2502420.1 hypothetical protein [Burkholderiales bacterium]